MKLSYYIYVLENLLEANGDLDVEILNWDDERIPAREPHIAYRQILKGRQKKDRFWCTDDKLKGDKVIRI
jgi:hypothetical protein